MNMTHYRTKLILDPMQHFASLITHCISTKNPKLGQSLHSHLIKTSLISDTFLSNRLIQMYCKYTFMQNAQKVFDELPIKNNYSWNLFISGCTQNGLFDYAYKLFDEMPEPDIVTYNAMISGLSNHGLYIKSLNLFKNMQRLYNSMFFDEFAVVSIVGTCAFLGAVRLLGQVHSVVYVSGLRFNKFICNALIDAYGKCGLPNLSFLVFNHMIERDVISWTSMLVSYVKACRMEDAFEFFCRMPVKNMVSWTALIVGFSQNGRGIEALSLFDEMRKEGLRPNAFTYVGVLGACADVALLEKGKQVHNHIIRCSASDMLNTYICNALIDMYSKCGDMRSASILFERIPQSDIVSWNSMITGLAQNGHGKASLQIFERMIKARVIPNHVTFLGALSACSHTGIAYEGLQIFDLMKDYGLKPRSDQYSILIDLLGRQNWLKEALGLIEQAPNDSNKVGMWGSLLGACRVHGNTDLAIRASEELFALEPNNAGRYIMLANIYSSATKWDDARQVRMLMDERGLRKEVAFSWIEVKDTRSVFIAKDKSHCQTREIYDIVHGLVDQMYDVGYVLGIESLDPEYDEEI